jgi:hypothetical protein
MFNAIKIWKKWKAFLPRSTYCSTAQSSLTINTVIHVILYVPALLKFFFMATPASLPVAATVWITMQHTQSSYVTDEATRLCQVPQLPEISQLYSEDGLMQCLTEQL